MRQWGGGESRTKLLIGYRKWGKLKTNNILVVRVGRMIASIVDIAWKQRMMTESGLFRLFVNYKNTDNWSYSITRFWMISEPQSKPELCLL